MYGDFDFQLFLLGGPVINVLSTMVSFLSQFKSVCALLTAISKTKNSLNYTTWCMNYKWLLP